MMKFNTLLQLSLFGLLVYPFTAAKAQVAAQSCNSSDVQTAINQATEGQTVTIPSGTCTWTSGVTISGKGISVQGAGAGRIIAYSSDTLTIGTGSKNINVTSALVNGSLSIANGQTLTVSETGNRQNYMVGTVSSYSSGTLTMNITSTGGSCGNSSSSQSPSNCKRWLISTIPSTVIVNNSTTTLFSVTEDSTYHTNLSGFKIQAGTGSGIGVQFTSGGGAAIILQNCWIEQTYTSGDAVNVGANRGVISNCSFDATPFSMSELAVHLQPYDETAWANTGYWGTLDTTGQHNFYVEDSDFHAYLNAADNDEGARSVFRYSTFDEAGYGTHGVDTSPIGQRYFEYYNNVGVHRGYSDGTTLPMDWWFFVRGGSFAIHDNTLPTLQSTDYSSPDINMTVMNLQRNQGPNPCWGAGTSSGASYYAPRQVGMGRVTGTGHAGNGSSTYSAAAWGYSSTEYVGDPEPAYIWNNSRAPLPNVSISDYGLGGGYSCPSSPAPDTSANYIVLNRDYYNGTTAKPGYTPYTYPHPLVGNGSQQKTATPPPPTGVTATAS